MSTSNMATRPNFWPRKDSMKPASNALFGPGLPLCCHMLALLVDDLLG